MRFLHLFIACFILCPYLSNAQEIDLSPIIFKEISNLYNPTHADFQLIQSHLANDTRPILKRMGEKEYVAREFRIIGNTPAEMPEQGCIFVNSHENDRENCVILYASFNEKYPEGVRRLIKVIKESDFNGHVHYKIGGWPNLEEGDLILAPVPFAFKPCFFKEVQRMGYKRALWLDSSILPAPGVSLNTIFDMINKSGYFVQSNAHTIFRFMNEDAAKAFGITLARTKRINSCSAAILGIDFTNAKAVEILDSWHQAAKDPNAFYSARSDQNALSIIFYQKGIRKFSPSNSLGSINRYDKNTLFLIDREYVKDKL